MKINFFSLSKYITTCIFHYNGDHNPDKIINLLWTNKDKKDI